MLELKNVKKTYKTKYGEVVALNGVSLTFPSKGMVFIVGKSGCGKTTLLNVIGGLDGIDSGEMLLPERAFSSFSASDYDDYRNTFIGFIFQEYNLLPEFTVRKNIEMAMEIQGEKGIEENLDSLMREMEISELKDRKISELSGGQRQRVAIARALIKSPRIILADEPTGALDSGTGEQVLQILKKLSKDKLIIVVSHDNDFAERYADRIIRLVDGNVAEDITFVDSEAQSNVCDNENELLIKSGVELSENDLKSIATAVKNSKKIQLVEKLSFRRKQPTDQEKIEKSTEKTKFKKSKMKFKSSLALGLKALSVKPIRLIFTVLLSVIAFAVFGLFDAVANFSTEKVLANLLKETDTTTVAFSGEYLIDYAHGDKYGVRISDKVVSNIEQETGCEVMPVYDIEYKLEGELNAEHKIRVNGGVGIDADISVGRYYYADSITGIVEFGVDDIKDDKVGNFGYRLVYGSYPQLSYDEFGDLEVDSLSDVAISSYVAESIKHYLQRGTINGKRILSTQDLLGEYIMVNQVHYRIVGIIDCGEIPEKYDSLKSGVALESSQIMLSEDFNRYVNSGAQRCLFMAKGVFDLMQETTNSVKPYFSGASTWRVDTPPDYAQTNKKNASEFIYKYQELEQEKVLFFDNGKTNLGEREVLIHPSNLQFLYATAIRGLNTGVANEVREKINALALDSTDLEIKKQLLEEFIALMLEVDSGALSKEIRLTKTSKETIEKTVRDVKVVGIYVGEYVIDARVADPNYSYLFSMQEKLMREFGIYTEQGDYARILVSTNGKGVGEIADYAVKKDGLALVWYKNSALQIIRDNESAIRQGANLFLYAAVVLAGFSVFMLFNYISTSISNKRQSVGVLRGLGARGKDVLIMFLSESMFIALISAAIAGVLAYVGCDFVNMYIIEQMNIYIPIALFDARQAFMICALSVLTAVLSSIIPIIRIVKTKPVELIRRF